MYLQGLRYIAFVFILLQFGDVQALPSVEFIREFVVTNHRSSVVLHVSDDTPIQDCMIW